MLAKWTRSATSEMFSEPKFKWRTERNNRRQWWGSDGSIAFSHNAWSTLAEWAPNTVWLRTCNSCRPISKCRAFWIFEPFGTNARAPSLILSCENLYHDFPFRILSNRPCQNRQNKDGLLDTSHWAYSSQPRRTRSGKYYLFNSQRQGAFQLLQFGIGNMRHIILLLLLFLRG